MVYRKDSRFDAHVALADVQPIFPPAPIGLADVGLSCVWFRAREVKSKREGAVHASQSPYRFSRAPLTRRRAALHLVACAGAAAIVAFACLVLHLLGIGGAQ